MKLTDIKDQHDTSLQSYAELLMEKADIAGLRIAMIFAIPDNKSEEGASLHLISNVQAEALPDFLSQLAAQMRRPPKGHDKLEVAVPKEETN